MTRSGIVWVLLSAVVFGGCSSNAQPVRADEVEVSVSGWVVAPEGQPVMVCGIFLTSDPPQCGRDGFEVRGLDLTALPGARSGGGVVWTDGLVELVGTLNTSQFILTVTEPASEPRVGELAASTEPPCDEPPGGWPPYAISNNDVDTIRGYGERNPDTWSGAWTDSGRQVWTVAFTGDLSAHEAALADLYDGPICVIRAEHTRAELDAIRSEIVALSVGPTEHGPAVREALVLEVSNHVWVLLWLNDEVALAPFSAFDKDTISVTGWAKVLETG